MTHQQTDRPNVDAGMIAWGVIVGAIIGGIVTLFTAPKRGTESRRQITEATQQVRTRIETAIPTPTDPVKDSLAEGKAAARRRRDELQLRDKN